LLLNNKETGIQEALGKGGDIKVNGEMVRAFKFVGLELTKTQEFKANSRTGSQLEITPSIFSILHARWHWRQIVSQYKKDYDD
jgi:hypothetical protein